MVALIALVAMCLFAAGVLAGIIGVVAVAIRREERNLTLTSDATDTVTRAGRWLNGLHVRAPAAPPPVTERRRWCSAREVGPWTSRTGPWPALPAGLRTQQHGLQP
jgi:hypothetical protein